MGLILTPLTIQGRDLRVGDHILLAGIFHKIIQIGTAGDDLKLTFSDVDYAYIYPGDTCQIERIVDYEAGK